MQYLDLIQGSPEWHAHRASHFNASDAPAMLGCSKYLTRTELLTRLKTGVTPEVDAATQRRFDDGHRFEALARPLAERIVGEALYPVTGTQGPYSASFDGLTLTDHIAFEHKTLNAELRNVLERIEAGHATQADLPEQYRVQMEQQCLVSGAQRVLFMATDWRADAMVEERHCWYNPDPTLRARLVAGWEQFVRDLATFVPTPAELKPTGRAPETLPALRIEVSGAVTASNLADFKTTALAAIRSVNRTLETDQDFADAERAVKWCEEVESRLKAAKEHALSQTASIDQLFKTMDDISAEARRVRLDLDKLVKARKEDLRRDIISAAQFSLGEAVRALEQPIGHGVRLAVSADFAGVLKAKRSLASMQDAVDTELARAKIAARELAARTQANIQILTAGAQDWTFLFPDLASVALQTPEAFAATVTQRVLQFEQDQAAQRAAQPSPVPAASNVVPLRSPEAAPGLLLCLSDINKHLRPLTVTGEALAYLGFEPEQRVKASKLYRASDLPAIGQAISAHVLSVTRQGTSPDHAGGAARTNRLSK